MLFPSLYEGFGLPVIEAFSLGIPVLTTNTSSLPEVSGGHAVTIKKSYDINSIKEGMTELLEGSKMDKKANLKQWASYFTYKKCAQEYSLLIDSFANR